MKSNIMKVQSSIEYLLVSSFILIIITILFVFSQSFLSSKQTEANSLIIEKNIREILGEAELVYLQGYPAKLTLNLNFPFETKILCNNFTLEYQYLNNKISLSTKFPIFCNISLHGIEKIVIKAEIDYVNITKV